MVGADEVVFGTLSPEKLVPAVEPRPPNVKAEAVPAVEEADCPNGVLKVDAVVTAPNGLIAENPLVPNVLVPEVLVPGVGVPNAVVVLPLPNVKPVDPPPNKLPVVAAAMLMK